MRLPIILIALISMAMAQQENAQRTARTPQAQIKYRDPNGLKVNWKFYAPQNQWRSHLENSQHPQQAETTHPQQSELNQRQPQSQLVQLEPDQLEHRSYSQPEDQQEIQQIPNQIQYKTYVQPQQAEAQPDPNQQLQYKTYPPPQAPIEAQPDPNQIHYSRYPDAPSHAKQVVLENYKPQSTYNEPPAFHYQSNIAVPQQYDQQPANAGVPHYEQSSDSYEQEEQPKSRREYADENFQGKIVYRSEYEQQEQEPQVEHIPVPVEKLPPPIPQKLVLDKNMPMQIQQLLQYQARLPYDVIANSITYKPKTLFVPKQLPTGSKGPYHYRSKVYYVNQDQYQDDIEATKPVEESHRH